MYECSSRIHNSLIECFPEQSSWSQIEQVNVVRKFFAITLPQVHVCVDVFYHTGVLIHCPSGLLVGADGLGILILPLGTSPSERAMYGPPRELDYVVRGGKYEPAVEPRS